jgi:hypothetical protein
VRRGGGGGTRRGVVRWSWGHAGRSGGGRVGCRIVETDVVRVTEEVDAQRPSG